MLKAGFRFITLPRFERYLGVEHEGFVVLIDTAHGQLKPFGQAGYLIGDGIGMLVERPTGRSFVWHNQSVPATPELLAAYELFRREVDHLLQEE